MQPSPSLEMVGLSTLAVSATPMLTGRTPVQPDTLFRIASVSKPITAAAILKLADDGRLGLDDRVLSLLPTVPPLAAPGVATHVYRM